MRLFVAITLSEELQKSITATLHEIKKQGIKGRYTPTQNLHLTLAFIGEVKDAEAVKAALETVTYKPFKLALSETGCFDDILWAGVNGNQGLSSAAKSVRDALSAAGIDYDRKKFIPHITLIRGVTGPAKKVPAPKGQMMVKKISLMKSSVKDGKRIYTEIFSV